MKVNIVPLTFNAKPRCFEIKLKNHQIFIYSICPYQII